MLDRRRLAPSPPPQCYRLRAPASLIARPRAARSADRITTFRNGSQLGCAGSVRPRVGCCVTNRVSSDPRWHERRLSAAAAQTLVRIRQFDDCPTIRSDDDEAKPHDTRAPSTSSMKHKSYGSQSPTDQLCGRPYNWFVYVRRRWRSLCNCSLQQSDVTWLQLARWSAGAAMASRKCIKPLGLRTHHH